MFEHKKDRIALPPANAQKTQTCCHFCISSRDGPTCQAHRLGYHGALRYADL